MSDKYCNFVRPSSSDQISKRKYLLNGEQARRLYLEEFNEVKDPELAAHHLSEEPKRVVIRKIENPLRFNDTELSDKDLFLSAQNNDVNTVTWILDNFPDKLNIKDSFGWSLLMIACQANAIETVNELLKREIDTSIRDKAGNSARSLVIKNKNLALVNIFTSYKSETSPEVRITKNHKKVKRKKEYTCDTCNKNYPDKSEHLSSTIHNINASKNKKIPTNYKIPESNRGYQIMVRGGWDKEYGLGPDGSGKKYPLRTVQKKDRKGLGHAKIKQSKKDKVEPVLQNQKTFIQDYYRNRKMEINFRREFY